MLGALLAVVSAAAFAWSNVSARRAVLSGSVMQGIAITVPMGVPMFVAAALVAGSLADVFGFSTAAAGYLAFAGVLHFVFGRYCNFRAVRAMGANLAGLMEQASLLVSLALALGWLNESLTPLKIFGIVLIIFGPAIAVRARRAAAPSGDGAAPTPGFVPRYAEGYGFAILSAACYGVSPILVRAALQGADAGVSVAGGLISYCAATLALAPLLVRRRERRHLLSIDGQAARWFTLSGLLLCGAQMIRYIALAVAPVTVVAPLLRTAIVFRIVLSRVVNPDHEVFGIRVVFGVVLSLIGALALTVDTEFALSLVSLPDAVVDAARWRWP